MASLIYVDNSNFYVCAIEHARTHRASHRVGVDYPALRWLLSLGVKHLGALGFTLRARPLAVRSTSVVSGKLALKW